MNSGLLASQIFLKKQNSSILITQWKNWKVREVGALYHHFHYCDSNYIYNLYKNCKS